MVDSRDQQRQKKREIYEDAKSFEKKTGDIFRLLGFDVEFNRRIAGNDIDILIKKKDEFDDTFRYYICECKDYASNVGVEWVNKYAGVLNAAINTLRNEPDASTCQALIVSSNGFTESAKGTAKANGIVLKTYDQLLKSLMNFDFYLDKIIRDFESSPLNKLYIQQDVIPEKTLKKQNSFDFVRQWLTQPEKKHFSLLGDYGTGKTSFTLALVCQLAKEYKENPHENRIPFLVDLKTCQKAISLEGLIHEQLKMRNVNPIDENIFLKLIEEGKILLVFDAFDEMATMNSAEITLKNFRQLNNAVKGDAKVILTSRTHYFRDKYEVETILKKDGHKLDSPQATQLFREIAAKPEYEIVHLKEFSDSQVREYLQKAIGKESQAAYDKIQAIYNLHDLSSRPVLLDMIVKTLPKIDTTDKNVEFNVVHLYDVYTYSWFNREDHRLQITKQGKEELVEGLAYRLWQDGVDKIHYTALSDLLSHYLKAKDKIKTTRDLEAADYEVRTASFLVRDGEGYYRFAHKSFQEFFLARRIKKELEKGNPDALALRRLSIEVVFFLRHLPEYQQKLIDTVAGIMGGPYRESISENALFIFYSIIKMSCFDQRLAVVPDLSLTGDRGREFAECLEKNLPHTLQFSGAALSDIGLSRMVFRNGDLTSVDMEKNRFQNARFENVDLSRARLGSCDFRHSEFFRVNFNGAVVRNGDFRDCVFRECTIKECDFSFSNFSRTRFQSSMIEGNDFTAVGFLDSDINFWLCRKDWNNLSGAGEPDSDPVAFSPMLNLGHEKFIRAVTVSPDNRWIVSGSEDCTVKVWNLETGALITTLKGHEKAVFSVTVSPDSRRIVSGSADTTIKVWDLETGTLITSFKGHNDSIRSVCVSPDGNRIVSGSNGQTIKVWNLETGALITSLKGHERAVLSVTVSPDNRHIVSGSADTTIKVWDLETGALITTFRGHNDTVRSVAVSPDSHRVVSGSNDRTVRVWDMKTGTLITTLRGHDRRVWSVAVSLDNRRIVSGSNDRTINIWDLENKTLITTLRGHKDAVNAVAVSPDNRHIVSGSEERAVKVWDLDTGSLIYSINGVAHMETKTNKLLHTTHILPGNNAITFFPDSNQYLPSTEESVNYLFYKDKLASYPASDLPQLRKKDYTTKIRRTQRKNINYLDIPFVFLYIHLLRF